MSASSPDRFIRFAAWLLAGATLPVFLAELPSLWLLIVSAGALSALAARFAWLRSGLFLLLGFTWVCWHASSSIDRVLSSELEKQPMLVSGRVVDLPQREADRLKILLRVEESYPHQAFADSGKLILNCYRCTMDIRAGERWQFRVKLKRPSGGVSPGAFDYEKWLFRHRVAATGYLVSGETGQADNGNQRLEPAGRLYYQVWRTDLQAWIQSVDGLSPRASGLFRALLIGDRSGLSNVDWRVLRSTGVAHLVAISGLHIGLIMVTIMFLARHILDFVPRLYLLCPRIWITRCLGLLGASGYAALAGFAVPTLRALLMIGLFILAHLLGRNISLFRLLFATVFILLLLDPFIAFDTGFWLSFGTVFIIAWSSSGIRSTNWLMAQPRLWLGMMPLLVLFFSHVSLVAPVANFVAIPVVSFLLIPAGLLASLLAGLGVEKPGALLMEYSGRVADVGLTGLEFLADIPMASLSYTPTGSVSAALIIVAGLMMTTPFQLHSPAIYLVMAVLAFVPAPASLQRGEFEVALLDVGQGLSIVITTRHSTTVYDTGPRYGPISIFHPFPKCPYNL